jgi:hypothetical protein
MKTIICLMILLVMGVFTSCESEDDKLMNIVAGTWDLSKINFKRDLKSDSLVTYTNSSLQFDNCGTGKGGCNGYLKLNNSEKLPFIYTPSGKAQEITISYQGEFSKVSTMTLLGLFDIDNVSSSSMTLKGKVLTRQSTDLVELYAEIQMKK